MADSATDDYLDSFTEPAGYLNWAAFGPFSPNVRAVSAADTEALGGAGDISAVVARGAQARASLARLLGVNEDAVTLHPSTTHALQQAITGLTGGVIASRAEFPSVTLPIVRAADAFGRVMPQLIDPPNGVVTPDAVAEALTSDTVAVAVSAVDFRTGHLADLGAIRDVIGDRLLIVDAIQAFGVTDVDWSVADVVCGNGYKWLRAGRGTGFASFSAHAREVITPVLSGPAGLGDGLVLDDLSAPVATPQAFAVSPADPLAASRLATSLAELSRAGVTNVAAAVAERAATVIAIAERHGVPVVSPTDPARRAGIVVLRPADPAAVSAALARHGVQVTDRGGAIRISPHAGTRPETLAMLDAALAGE